MKHILLREEVYMIRTLSMAALFAVVGSPVNDRVDHALWDFQPDASVGLRHEPTLAELIERQNAADDERLRQYIAKMKKRLPVDECLDCVARIRPTLIDNHAAGR
jgi:hypothetical protein